MPRDPRSAVVLGGGDVLPCLVIDMSASGIAVSADYEPALGEPLAVGRMIGRVVRRLEVGFAVQFIEPLGLEVVEELMRAPEEWERATRANAASRAVPGPRGRSVASSATSPEERNAARISPIAANTSRSRPNGSKCAVMPSPTTPGRGAAATSCTAEMLCIRQAKTFTPQPLCWRLSST
jgi:hypothetical protein